MNVKHHVKLTLPHAIIVVGMLAFFGFVLWLTASHFDASEWKSLGGMAIGVIGREFIPTLQKLLSHTTQAFSDGGQVE